MSITKSLVSTFLLLQQHDTESTKFTKLANLYGAVNFSEKLVMKFYNDYKTNRKDITKLTYFKNTNINKVLITMPAADKQTVMKNLRTAFKLAEQSIMMGGETEHQCGDNCNHTDKHVEQMLGGKKLQKMLKKKGVREHLQKTLGKQFGTKGANIEEMLKSAMKDNLPAGEASMINSLISNPMVKQVSEQLLNEENLGKMKTIFMDFIASEDVVDEINNIKSIFNEEKIMRVMSELFSKVQSLDDISNIQSMVEDNADIKDIVTKFENAMKSGLINEERLAALAQKAADKFMGEFKNMGILDGKNMGMLKTLMSQFGGDMLGIESKPEKKMSKQERRAKAQKKYRRNKRTELKKKKRGRNSRK